MKKRRILIGQVLDERSTLTLEEFSCACAMRGEWVIELVHEGILEPVSGDAAEERSDLRFSAATLVRARRVMRLQRDLGVNLSGAALALELMDEIAALRARLEVTGSGE